MLTRLLSSATKVVGSLADAALGHVLGSGSGRRIARRGGRAYIEVRGVHQPGTSAAARAVERALTELPGVERAEITAPLGRVAVWHDPERVPLASLVQAVAKAERVHGLAEEQPAERSAAHPADPWLWLREAARIGVNLAGTGYAVGARVLPALPPVVPAVISLIDHTPVLRQMIESRVGSAATDAVIGVVGTAGNVLAHQPMDLLLDSGQRWCLLREAQARHRAWQEWEQATANSPGSHRAEPLECPPRETPLPPGPLERVANQVGTLGLVSSAAVAGVARSPERALGVLRAGTPKAARLGREAFAAQLGVGMAARDVVVLDPSALRRLDRVDIVVLDAGVLQTGRMAVEQVLSLTGDADDEAELSVRAHELVDLTNPKAAQRRDGWSVALLNQAGQTMSELVGAVVKAQRDAGATVLGVRHRNRLVGVVTVLPELDPYADALLAAARRAGTVVLAGASSRLDRRLAVRQVVPGGSALARSVRELQDDGHGVVLVSARGRRALAAADVGIGVAGRSAATPWDAHLLCGPDLAGACALLGSVAVARTASRRSAQLALAGSALGGTLAVIGPAAGAAGRASMPVHGTALFALAAGTWYGLSATRTPAPVPAQRVPWHAMPPDAVLTQLRTTESGLDAEEADRRGGERRVEPHEEADGLGRAVVDELANPITPVLAAGAGVSAGVGAVTDALMIGGAMGMSALLGGVQRLGAQRALRALGQRSATTVALRRDGRVLEADADALVPGDVIELDTGDAVPADCRLLEADGIEVDESSLTGESQLVAKTTHTTPRQALADRRCMLYQGTVIAAGTAVAAVVATGVSTEVGCAARNGEGKTPPSGVQTRLRSLTKITLPLSAGAGAALLGIDVLRGQPMGQALGRAVSLAVAAVPEGLPFVATVAELAAARRLSQRGALVRNSSTVEALGRVDTLCFDKTGTLTEGHIALRRISNGAADVRLDDARTAEYRAVAAAALRATPGGNGSAPLPHRTDQAVVDGARALGVTATEGAASWTRVDELHFEPSRGYHAVLGCGPEGHRLSVKGAPEIVLERCTRWSHPEGGIASDAPFDDAARRAVDAEVDRLARRGYRVLAVAERPASDRADLDESRIAGLHLVGLLALADPIRPTAAEAVRQLQQAGVTIVMVTGDHPSTAESIAAELDALNGRRIVTGPELDEIDDEALAVELPDVAVFARVSPEQKARIVRGLRESGRVVAVTGDGANDAPAIRLADVGIALGAGATPAAREAADVVVTDDRIETITDAVVEGRAMWSSVRDAVAILLGGNLGEIAFTLGAGVLGGHDALNARQLLLVNLLTDVLPSMAVAVRPPPGVTAEVLLAEGPDSSLGSALTREIYVRAATTASGAMAGWLAGRLAGTRGQASTVGLVALVTTQLGQTMAVRGRTPLVVGAGAASLAALAAVVQVPGVSHFFGCRPLGPQGWAIALGSAAAATIAVPPLVRRFAPSP